MTATDSTTTFEAVDPRVHEFLTRSHKLYINGDWSEPTGGQSFAALNPADDAEIAQIPAATSEDVDRAVNAARAAFTAPAWARMSGTERARLLWRLADLIDQHTEELAQLETLDQGKPLSITRSGDVPGSAETFRYMAGWATKLEGSTIPVGPTDSFHAYTRVEPVGVVGQIVPWNFPLAMAAWKLAPALAAGCTVVLKPAEETSLSTLRLAELVAEAGFPPGVVNIVTGDGPTVGAAITAHPDIDKVAFTGSTPVGKQIVQAAAGNLKRVSLELGGKNSCIIWPDADIDAAVHGAFRGAFANAGQVCTASSRVLVHSSIIDAVTEALAERASAVRVGSGFDPSSQIGPLISRTHMNRVDDYLQIGIDEGAVLAHQGTIPDSDGYFVAPTILTRVTPQMRIAQEEIFGPVVTIEPFSDEDHVASLANNTRYGLVSEVWTRDVSRAHRLAAALETGTVWVNGRNMDIALPFGGLKESGWGREKGAAGIELYTQTKTVGVAVGS